MLILDAFDIIFRQAGWQEGRQAGGLAGWQADVVGHTWVGRMNRFVGGLKGVTVFWWVDRWVGGFVGVGM